MTKKIATIQGISGQHDSYLAILSLVKEYKAHVIKKCLILINAQVIRHFWGEFPEKGQDRARFQAHLNAISDDVLLVSQDKWLVPLSSGHSYACLLSSSFFSKFRPVVVN